MLLFYSIIDPNTHTHAQCQLWKLLCQYYQKFKADKNCKLYSFLKEILEDKSSSRVGMSTSIDSWISLDSGLLSKVKKNNKEVITGSESKSSHENDIQESPTNSINEKMNSSFQISSSESETNESLDKFFKDDFYQSSQKNEEQDDNDNAYGPPQQNKEEESSPENLEQDCEIFDSSQKNEQDYDIYCLNTLLGETSNSEDMNSSKNELSSRDNRNSSPSKDDNNLENLETSSSKKSQICDIKNYTFKKSPKSENCLLIKNNPCIDYKEDELDRDLEASFSKNKEKENVKEESKEFFKKLTSTQYSLPLYFQSQKNKSLKNQSVDIDNSKNPFKIKHKEENIINNKFPEKSSISKEHEENKSFITKNPFKIKTHEASNKKFSENSEIANLRETNLVSEIDISSSSAHNNLSKINNEELTSDKIKKSLSFNTSPNFHEITLENKIDKYEDGEKSEKYFKKCTPSKDQERKSIKRKKFQLCNTPKITKYFKSDKS